MTTQVDPKTREALDIFQGFLKGKKLSRDNPVLEHALAFVKRPGIGNLPSEDREALVSAIRNCFSLSEAELLQLMSGISFNKIPEISALQSKSIAQRTEAELWQLVPRGGYLEKYCTYTLQSEAPLAYHLFCSLVAVGCILGRKIWMDMGYYRLYPPLGVFILGPSGLRKTSAANIVLKLITAIELTKLYPQKFTPESLAVSVSENGQGLLYAPEMAATLGKQKYLEGLIPLLTSLQDCPDSKLEETIGRGKILLKDVAISLLMCSTPDWFVSNTPTDTFGGGFIARQIMVMQTDTPREEDIPELPRRDLKDELIEELIEMSKFRGAMSFSATARAFHREWYHEHRERTKHPEHPLLGTYFQRKPDHIKRIAMCIHIAESGDLVLSLRSLQQAISIMDWIEQFIPPMLQSMFKTPMGESHDFVVQTILHAGGTMGHSALVRKVQHKMNASQLRSVIGSLVEAEMLLEIKNNLQHIYMIRGQKTPEGAD